ncbi:1011_t:CDS:1, partial [Acaulospora morrowiae]
ETLSLNNVRKNVMLLSKPLAEIGQLIQVNISIIKDQQKEIENSHQSIEDLRSRLHTTLLDLTPKKLGHPRTVCTNKSCTKTISVGKNLTKVDYITHCHTRCYLKNVEPNLVNNAALRECAAMNNTENCGNCSCHWSKHMHITYENKHTFIKVIDENVVKLIKEKVSYQDTKKAIIDDKEQYISRQKEEQKRISSINIKLAQFLRQNAIAAYNDTYAEYLDHFINEEKTKKSSDPAIYDNRILIGLEAVKREYSEKISIIKKAIETNDPSVPPFSLKEISDLIQELYELPLNGQTLKKIKMEAELGRNFAFKYEEKRCMFQGNNFWNHIFK